MLKVFRENRKLRKENEELRKAIKEALRELNDADCLNKSIVIMSASIRLERALKRIPKSGHSTGSKDNNSLSQPYCKAEREEMQ